MMLIPVDIILPCYNPGNNWHFELINFYEEAKKNYNINFILVDDGSTLEKIQDTVLFLKHKDISIHQISYPKNMGKGYALREGVKLASSKFIIYTDIDFPFTTNSMLNVLSALTSNNCDVVAGYRNQNYYLKSMTLFRKMLSKSFRFFIKNLLGMSITDTQCGLKAFNEAGKIKFLSTEINRYLFDFEFIYVSSKDKSIRIEAVPVHLKDNVVFSKMKLKVLFQEIINLGYVLIFKKN